LIARLARAEDTQDDDVSRTFVPVCVGDHLIGNPVPSISGRLPNPLEATEGIEARVSAKPPEGGANGGKAALRSHTRARLCLPAEEGP
jgi:hypothetical protein